MSERMTSIDLPGIPRSGFAVYGRRTPAEMVAQFRRAAEEQKATAEAVLAAADQDFRVETFLGPLVRRNIVILQRGRR